MASQAEPVQQPDNNAAETSMSIGKLPSNRTRRTLPTSEAYNIWASTYDTDGNILQALDNFALESDLLPRLLHRLADEADSNPDAFDDGVLQVLDFGCGTGRAVLNFVAGLQASQNADAMERLLKAVKEVQIIGLDSSSGMLDVARSKVFEYQDVALFSGGTMPVRTSFYTFDILAASVQTRQEQMYFSGAPHAILSTLVLEHVAIEPYFSALSTLLLPPKSTKTRTLLVLTNMHAGMPKAYAGTQAAFNTSETEKTLAGTSYPHAINDVVNGAKQSRWKFLGKGEEDLREIEVTQWMVQGENESNQGRPEENLLGPRGKKWIGVKCWFGGLLQRS